MKPSAVALEIVSEGLMTTRQACEYLTISHDTLERLYAAGELPRVKVGRQNRWPRKAIHEFLARNLAGG